MDEGEYFDPIYKGCTSPSMAFGIPFVPFVLVTLGFIQVALISFFRWGVAPLVVLAIVYGFVFTWARRVSRNDDQRLLQMFKRIQMRGRQGATRRVWGAVSFSPYAPRKK